MSFSNWDMPTEPPMTSPFARYDPVPYTPLPEEGPTKQLPAYAVIDPSDIGNLFQAIATAPDIGVGLTRHALPGLSGVGDILGNIGSSISSGPLGEPLDTFRRAVTGGAETFLKPTLEAVGSRIGDIGTEIGRTFDDDNPDDWKLLDALPRFVGATLLGKTGAGAFDFGQNQQVSLEQLKTDALHTAEIASLIPALKVAKAFLATGAAKELGKSSVGNFFEGLTKPLADSTSNTVARSIGQWTGKAVIADSVLGLGAEYALPNMAADQEWAREIMDTRIVNQDSPWRFPFEIATSLPLDIVGMAGKLNELRAASGAGSRILGDSPLAHARMRGWDVPTYLDQKLATPQEIAQYDQLAMRTAAADKWLESFNMEHNINLDSIPPELRATYEEVNLGKGWGALDKEGARGFSSIEDIPGKLKSNEDIAREVDFTLKDMRARLPDEEIQQLAHESAEKAWKKQSPDWAELEPVQQFELSMRYLRSANPLEARYSGKILSVANKEVWIELQAPRAYDYLAGLPDVATAQDFNNVVSKYPAIREAMIPHLAADGTFLAGEARRELGAGKWMKITPEAELTKLQSELDSLLAKKKPSKKDLLQIANKEALIAQNKMPRSGAIEQTMDLLLRRIAAGGKHADELDDLRTELKKAYEREIVDIRKKADTARANIELNRQDLLDPSAKNLTADDVERIAVATRQLEDDLDGLMTKHSTIVEGGYRWELTHHQSPVLFVKDAQEESLKLLSRRDRTKAGEVFNKLFGPIPSRKLAEEGYENIRAGLKTKYPNAKPEDIQDYLKRVKENIDRNRNRGKNAHLRTGTTSIFNEIPHTLNNIEREWAIAQGFDPATAGMKASEMVYRAMPGPIKIFTDTVFNKHFDLPYKENLHSLTRHFYPMFRFLYSPRFFLMNYMEAPLLGTARGGLKYITAPSLPQYERLGREISHEALIPGGIEHGRIYNVLAKMGYTMREDGWVKAVLDSIKDAPENMDFVDNFFGKKLTNDQWYDELMKISKRREDILHNTAAQTADEIALQTKIATEKAKLPQGIGNRLKAEEKIQELQHSLDKKIVERQFAEQGIEGGPLFEEIQRRAILNDLNNIRDIRQMIYGNPSRSSVERVLNSYFLYWPISYQLKASKALADFLTSKMFGYQTGSAGAITYNHLRKDVEDKIESDPEFNDHFNNNRQALFVLRQFFPITPEDIGVSLSRYTRLVPDVVSGEKNLGSALLGAATVGPIYDIELVRRILSEQSKSGSIIGDALGVEE